MGECQNHIVKTHGIVKYNLPHPPSCHNNSHVKYTHPLLQDSQVSSPSSWSPVSHHLNQIQCAWSSFCAAIWCSLFEDQWTKEKSYPSSSFSIQYMWDRHWITVAALPFGKGKMSSTWQLLVHSNFEVDLGMCCHLIKAQSYSLGIVLLAFGSILWVILPIL